MLSSAAVERALHSRVKCDGRERDLTWSASGLQNSAPFIITPDVNSPALLTFCRHRRHLRLRRIHTRPEFSCTLSCPFFILFFLMRQACNIFIALRSAPIHTAKNGETRTGLQAANNAPLHLHKRGCEHAIWQGV